MSDDKIAPAHKPDFGSLDPRKISPVPPPPMLVVHKGWWKTTVTEVPAEELIRRDRERRRP